MHCLPTFNLSDHCQPNSRHMRAVYLDASVCVCVDVCVWWFLEPNHFSTLYCLRKSSHLMSLAITDDISVPVCLSQDSRSCLPMRRTTPLSSQLRGNQCGEDEVDTLSVCRVFVKLFCPRPLPLTDQKPKKRRLIFKSRAGK